MILSQAKPNFFVFYVLKRFSLNSLLQKALLGSSRELSYYHCTLLKNHVTFDPT